MSGPFDDPAVRASLRRMTDDFTALADAWRRAFSRRPGSEGGVPHEPKETPGG